MFTWAHMTGLTSLGLSGCHPFPHVCCTTQYDVIHKPAKGAFYIPADVTVTLESCLLSCRHYFYFNCGGDKFQKLQFLSVTCQSPDGFFSIRFFSTPIFSCKPLFLSFFTCKTSGLFPGCFFTEGLHRGLCICSKGHLCSSIQSERSQ